jgi:hypothetical protein
MPALQRRGEHLGAKIQNPSHPGAHFTDPHQGCQIFLGTTYQNGKIYAKWP